MDHEYAESCGDVWWKPIERRSVWTWIGDVAGFLTFLSVAVTLATNSTPRRGMLTVVLIGSIGCSAASRILFRWDSRRAQIRVTSRGLFVRRFFSGERMVIVWDTLDAVEYRPSTSCFLLRESTGREFRVHAFRYGDSKTLLNALMKYAPAWIEAPKLPAYTALLAAKRSPETDPFVPLQNEVSDRK